MNEKPKILIADDSEINRALLKEILGDGYDYLEAEDGAAAVELMRQRTDISLLLLDLMMPGMDGFDVLRVMKYHAWLDEIPVIVISAAEDTANIERAYDLGVTDYIRRPFERIMVLCRVKNVLMLYAKQKRLTRLVQSGVRKRTQQRADDQHPEPCGGVPQQRERAACPAHPHPDRPAFAPAGAKDRSLSAGRKRYRPHQHRFGAA